MKNLLVIFASCVFFGSCGVKDVECTFRFPDEESFLMADYIRLEVYPLEAKTEELCEILMMGQPIPDKALLRQQSLDPCEVLETTPAIPMGDFAGQLVMIFGEVKGEDDVALLRACIVSQIDGDDIEQVDLNLERTDHYPDSVTPSCSSKEQKCNFSKYEMPCPES